MRPYADITDPKLAKALAHPLRTRILAALEDRTASPSELAEELGASLGVVSYHVRRLASLGFLKLVKRTHRRGAVEHYYTTTARPRITDAGWAATPAMVKQATVRAALDQIGAHVGAAAAAGGFDAADAHLTRSPVTVDEKGWKALARELEAFTTRIQKIEADSERRLARVDHDGEQQASVVLMLFNSVSPAPAPSDGKHRRAAPRKRAASSRRSG